MVSTHVVVRGENNVRKLYFKQFYHKSEKVTFLALFGTDSCTRQLFTSQVLTINLDGILIKTHLNIYTFRVSVLIQGS